MNGWMDGRVAWPGRTKWWSCLNPDGDGLTERSGGRSSRRSLWLVGQPRAGQDNVELWLRCDAMRQTLRRIYRLFFYISSAVWSVAVVSVFGVDVLESGWS